jgi:hypothetical protein
MARTGKRAVADRAKRLADGTTKHLDVAEKVRLDGQVLARDDVAAKLRALGALRDDVDAADATTKTKLEAERSQGPALRAFMAAYVALVKLAFGNRPDILADFGLSPRKAPAPLTAEQKAAAVAKRAATRAARGTKGPRQKAAIKGNVTGVVVTPIER